MESPTTETGEYLEAAAIAVCYKWGLEPWTLNLDYAE